MLLDPPLEHYVQEWKPPELIAANALFFISAAAIAGLWLWRRRSLTRFEQWALPLLEIAAFRAVRNAVWFELAAVVALPRLVDRGEVVLEASVRRANVILGSAAAVVAVVVLALELGGATGRIDSNRPPGEAAAVATAAGTRGVVLADDDHADWLLWLQPLLAGRVAYDVRFELFSSPELHDIQLLHDGSAAIWRRCGVEARVVTFGSRGDYSTAAAVIAHGSRTIVDTPSFIAVSQPVTTRRSCARA